MLPISQTLNALPGLNRTAKALLIEVCGLAENGTLGYCNAKNDYFTERLSATERTITRRLTELEQRGLLHCTGLGKARRLRPSTLLRACYAAATDAERRAAAQALNLDKPGATNLDNLDTLNPDNLDTTGTQPRQNGEVGEVATAPNLDIVGAQPRQTGYSNLDNGGTQPRQNGSRVIGDEKYEYYEQDQLTPGERARLEKKIGDLQQQVTLLKAQLARTPAPPVAGRPPTGYRDFTGAWPESLTPPFQTPAFLASWATYAGYAAEIGKPFGPISEKLALTELGRYAAGDHSRALRILSHNITQRYRTLTNDDGTQTPRPATGQRGAAAGPGRVETLPATSYGRNRPSADQSPTADPTPAAAA